MTKIQLEVQLEMARAERDVVTKRMIELEQRCAKAIELLSELEWIDSTAVSKVAKAIVVLKAGGEENADD